MKKFFMFLGLSLLIIGTASAQLYKWIDEEGNIYYGDSPPANYRPQQIEVPPSPSAEDVQRSKERVERLIRKQEARENEREVKRQLERSMEQHRKEELKKRCKVLRSRLFLLKQPGVITMADDAGNLMRPSDEMRERMIREIEAFIEKHCE